MTKIIFFDFDGTIFSHETKNIPKSTLKALKVLNEKDIKTFLCTGRSLVELDEFDLKDTYFDGYITINGQIIWDNNRNIIYANPFNKELLNIVIEDFNKKRYPILLINENDNYLNFQNNLVKRVQDSISSPMARIDQYHNETIYMCCYYLEDTQKSELDKLKEYANITYWRNNGIDVIPIGSSKAKGIKELLKILSIKQEETMSFGDGENDIEMLKYTKESIVMGNGEEETKKYATYITSGIDEDGISKALKYYKLI